MREFMTTIKALADENRLRALLAINGRELCVCQIIDLLGLAPSTVSKHMSILRQARLVVGRKEGRWMYYRLSGREAPVDARKALDWVCGGLAGKARIREDARRLKEIVKRGSQACSR